MKKSLLFVVSVMLFVFQPKVLAVGVDTNVCVIAEYNNNYDLNGTNCTMVKVVYPSSWTLWYLITSTNLSAVGGGWFLNTGSAIGFDAGLGLPRWKKWYIKNSTNDHYRFFAVSTNSVYKP
jgi:hypothetical protein